MFLIAWTRCDVFVLFIAVCLDAVPLQRTHSFSRSEYPAVIMSDSRAFDRFSFCSKHTLNCQSRSLDTWRTQKSLRHSRRLLPRLCPQSDGPMHAGSTVYMQVFASFLLGLISCLIRTIQQLGGDRHPVGKRLTSVDIH